MMNKIADTVAIVTGGSSGLGLATVKWLLDQGAKGVVSLDLKKPDINHPNLLSVTGDVCMESDVEDALKECEEKFGIPSVLVNCAGILYIKKIYEEGGQVHPLDDFKRVLDVNVTGTFNVVRLAARLMVKNEMDPNGQKGVIVMTSSVASYDAQSGLAAYAASKGAINGMTLGIARDLASSGIRCVSIAPGMFQTPMARNFTDEACKEMANLVPCPKRFGKPEEYAHLVQSIIENPMLNGEVIRLDGAVRMPP